MCITYHVGLSHLYIICSNVSIFVDFGYDWQFMLSLSKFMVKKMKSENDRFLTLNNILLAHNFE